MAKVTHAKKPARTMAGQDGGEKARAKRSEVEALRRECARLRQELANVHRLAGIAAFDQVVPWIRNERHRESVREYGEHLLRWFPEMLRKSLSEFGSLDDAPMELADEAEPAWIELLNRHGGEPHQVDAAVMGFWHMRIGLEPERIKRRCKCDDPLDPLDTCPVDHCGRCCHEKGCAHTLAPCACGHKRGDHESELLPHARAGHCMDDGDGSCSCTGFVPAPRQHSSRWLAARALRASDQAVAPTP